ncbi:MAG: four helix bundle protein [Acidobacteriota bacterium]|nr:four helix bundle protein [Acidobacteriota bacterium]
MFPQIDRCAPSADANYRAVCRARSRKEFVARLGVALEEADETVVRLETIRDARLAPQVAVHPLLKEAVELRAILAASYRTARRNLREAKSTDHQIKRSPS